MKKWIILQSRYIFQTAFFRVRQDQCQLPSGLRVDDYYVIEENDIGMVFGLTPARELLLVEQYKHGIGEYCLELPAGMFNGTDSADGENEARREFVEETGYDAAQYHPVAHFIKNPTRQNNYVHVYAAIDVYPSGQQRLDANEDIAVRLMPIQDVFERIRAGDIRAGDSVAAIYLGWDFVRRTLGVDE